MERRNFLKKIGGALTATAVTALFGSTAARESQAAAQPMADLDPQQAAKERLAIRVDPKIYNAYVGRYQFGPGRILTITKENNRLMREGSGGVKAELFPISETRFFRTDVGVLTIFIKNRKGQVTHVVHRRNGQEAWAYRIG